ncbi:MAG: 4-hydroxy-3-methylbut-2-enyl diphosphate reductase [Elusimicrobia bacterium]|nr:4-hydroxy-3-methylbut-2-enyl diphosphate reductase [Elusimicrobiota bacterium]MBI4217670.1 4-hydroxy-3-methylbut-2-enyl diphosphate reductase [Elusimicrobiota bacterium]
MSPIQAPQKLILARPRGFCAGVERAIEIVEIALKVYPPPVYVYHEIVHNRYVVQDLGGRGAIFVDSVSEVPDRGVLVFSAHGVSPEIREQTKSKKLKVIDATCPLVTKVHMEAILFAKQGRTILLVGHQGHDEVVGTMGEAPEKIVLVDTPADVEKLEVEDPEKVAVITQTTLSLDDSKATIDAIKQKFPKVVFPPKEDICYATTNRQIAVKELTNLADLILVIGSENSSNSKRLAEVSQDKGVHAYLIDDVSKIREEWFANVNVVGVTAGASAPEHLVQEVIDYFKRLGVTHVEEIMTVSENVKFALPPELSLTSSVR